MHVRPIPLSGASSRGSEAKYALEMLEEPQYYDRDTGEMRDIITYTANTAKGRRDALISRLRSAREAYHESDTGGLKAALRHIWGLVTNGDTQERETTSGGEKLSIAMIFSHTGLKRIGVAPWKGDFANPTEARHHILYSNDRMWFPSQGCEDLQTAFNSFKDSTSKAAPLATQQQVVREMDAAVDDYLDAR